LNASDPYLSPVFFSETGAGSLYFAAPVLDPAAGTPVGVLVLRYNADVLQELATRSTRFMGEQSYAILLDENNLILAHGAQPRLRSRLIGPLDDTLVTRLQLLNRLPPGTLNTQVLAAPESAAALQTPADNLILEDALTANIRSQSGRAHLVTQTWQVIFVQSRQAALNVVRKQLGSAWIVAVAVVLVGLIGAWALARWLTRPITHLQQTALQVAGGNLQVQARIESGDEIGALAQTFNEMTERLRTSVESLEQNVAERTIQLDERISQLELINHVGNYITLLKDESILLPTIADLIRGAFEYYAVLIFLPDKTSAGLKLRAASVADHSRQPAADLCIPLGTGLIGAVAEQGEPLNAENAHSDPRCILIDVLPEVRSELALPLRVGGQMLGVLDLQSTQLAAFSANDAAVMQILANQIAVAIYNAGLFMAEAEAHLAADSLREVGQLINSTLDSNEVLERILSALVKVLYYDSGSIMLLEGGELVIKAARGFANLDEILGIRMPLKAFPLNEQIITQASPVVLDDVELDPRWQRTDRVPTSGEVHSWIGVPLVSSGKVLGMLAVDNYRTGAYTINDIPVVMSFANQAAIALDNARLYAQLHQRAQQLATLNELARIVSGELDRRRILVALCEQMRQVIPLDSFHGSLYDAQINTLQIAVRYDLGEYRDETTGPLDQFPWSLKIIQNRQPVLYMRTAEEMAAETERRRLVGDKTHLSASLMFAPLIVGTDILGVISIQSYSLNAYQPEDLDLLVGTARQTAIALRNAELYEQAQTARAEAEIANQLKTRFMANMSHELRTPLNSIINFAYLLLQGTEGEMNAGQADLLQRIEASGHHLLGVINDILDLAKIEAGRMELFFEDLDITELIDGVMATAVGFLRDRPIALRREIPTALPRVHADRTRIRQVLLNLLSNAAKFTESGQIVVSAAVDQDGITVCVADTGIGMTAEDIPRAFSEFVQLDSGSTRQRGGTGLGLPISKRFVEMHGGRIWVDSIPGQGSQFYFSLPCLPTGSVREPEPNRLSEARVLVIDDDRLACDTLAAQLAQGYQVQKLSDSRRAVEAAALSHPDVIVLDVMMPYMDGWDVLRALRANPDTHDIPVVVCSVLNEQQLAFSLQANEYLVKPIERDALRRAVERLVPDGGKVLAVDDDPNALEIVRLSLGSMSYQVATVQDGKAGLDVALRDQPDIIILDLMMPGFSGFEVLQALRANPQTAAVPVIVISAKDLTPEEQLQLQAGAALFLQKGQFTADELIRSVQRVVHRTPKGGSHG
jgi:signal transduction histidine kinase/DNA-binding response OmpR family regulator/HAMP domain-containing protein